MTLSHGWQNAVSFVRHGFLLRCAPLHSPAMFGSILSVLLMGMVPAWGTQEDMRALSGNMQVAPPALVADLLAVSSLEQLSASGVIVADLESGQMLFGRAEAKERPMANCVRGAKK